MKMKFIFSFLALLLASQVIAQTGVVKGSVVDAITGESLPFTNVIHIESGVGVASDLDGNFYFAEIAVGLQTFSVSFIGYREARVSEVLVKANNPAVFNVSLEPASTEFEEAVIKPSSFSRPTESPVSMRSVGIAEIERSPGGNRDISKVIGTLPGVAQGVAFRNDLIIRGGGPNENRFYIDDVETPNINHFATQGASGGPVGMIDVNYLQGVDFFSGAFPTNTGNALSAVLRMKYRDARDDRLGLRFTLGASDIGFAAEGPLGERTTYLASIRRSYLQFLFTALDLPFLPTYNDLQFKVKTKLKNRDEFYVIFLGAFDQNALNLDANETEAQRYILSYLPEQDQWNYTNGYVYKHYGNAGVTTIVASRNMLSNAQTKFANNDSEDDIILSYKSQEAENKFRVESTRLFGQWKTSYGVGYEYADYTNSTFSRIATTAGEQEVNYDVSLGMNKAGAWAQASRILLQERLKLSFGFRTDLTDYSSETKNPLDQFSPRVSASFNVSPTVALNFNAGRYYQLPSYTTLGFSEAGSLVNQVNGLGYIRADHLVAGFAWDTKIESQISIEGFWKNYDNYPISLRDSVSLANFGSEFGVVGDVPVSNASEGRAFGAEFLYRQLMFKGFYGILAYTYVRSEFGTAGNLAPSAWDQRHLVSLTAGKKFNKGWELGLKWRYSAGSPYTPLDVAQSSLIENYNVNPLGIRDYSQLNASRIAAFHALDLRIDKKVFLKNLSMNFYLDIQNSYNFIAEQPPLMIAETDAAGNFIIDQEDPTRYQTRLEDNPVGSVLPTIGVIIEY